MAIISIRVSSEEEMVLKDYAHIHQSTVSGIIKKTMMEKIEDEFDVMVTKEYLKEKEQGFLKTRPIDALLEELDI